VESGVCAVAAGLGVGELRGGVEVAPHAGTAGVADGRRRRQPGGAGVVQIRRFPAAYRGAGGAGADPDRADHGDLVGGDPPFQKQISQGRPDIAPELAKTFEHGLGVTPLSILRFNIRGDGFTRFRGGVGHHPLGKNANLSLKVSTEIYLDERLIWSSGKLSADEPAKLFDLDIRDGSVLELIGYDVDAETWRDFIDWVDLRLTR